MASDDLKDAIVDYFQHDFKSASKDWKRVQKRQLPQGTLREFHNAKLQRTVYTLGDEDDALIVEKDVWIYGYAQDENGQGFFAFEPRDRWMRRQRQYDQHQQPLLEAIWGIEGLEEDSENIFVCDNDHAMRQILEEAGFVYDTSYSQLLSGHARPGPGSTGLAPIDPPTPKMLQAPGSKPTSSKKTRPLQTEFTELQAVMDLCQDERVWIAEYGYQADQKQQIQVPIRHVEQLRKGVVLVSSHEWVETNTPLYRNAQDYKAQSLQAFKGRVHPCHIDRSIDASGVVRYTVSPLRHLAFLVASTPAGFLVEVYHAPTRILGAHILSASYTATRATTLAQQFPVMGEDPSLFSGRILFGEFFHDDDTLAFICGYETKEGELCDHLDIPLLAFQQLFPDYEGEWNAAEAYHRISPKPGQDLLHLEHLVRERLTQAGCVEF